MNRDNGNLNEPMYLPSYVHDLPTNAHYCRILPIAVADVDSNGMVDIIIGIGAQSNQLLMNTLCRFN